MSTTRTREDMVEEVAKVLGELTSGQVLSAEDFTEVDSIIDPAIDELAEREVFYVQDRQEFENYAFLSLVDAIAALGAGKFHVSKLRDMDIESFRTLAERRLKRLAKVDGNYKVMKAEYY